MALRAGYYGLKRRFKDKLESIALGWDQFAEDVVMEDELTNILRDGEVIPGKNLLKNNATSGSTNGTTYTVNDKKQITFSTTPNGNFGIPINTSFKLPKGKYVLSGISGGSGTTYYLQGFGNVDYTTGSGIFAGSGPVTFTLTAENTLTLTLYIRTGFSGTETTVSPMICTEEEWNKSHDYAPFYVPLKDAIKVDEAAIADHKTTINAIISAATGAADFAAFKTAMGAITPVTRSAAPVEDTRSLEIEEEPVVEKKTTRKKSTAKAETQEEV